MNKEAKAKMLAEHVHRNQTYGIFPYMYHIEQVVTLAKKIGFDSEIIQGCYLHDALEDGNLSYNDIKKNFGINVAEIVYGVTDELGRNRKERKAKTYQKLRSNWKALAVKLCDRIANVENSKKHKPELFKMYQKEHETFKEVLFSASNKELISAWIYLDHSIDVKEEQTI